MSDDVVHYQSGSAARIVAALPSDDKARLLDAEARAGWDRAVERVNARIEST